MKTMAGALGLILLAGIAGCATAAPPELVEARSAYARASSGPAAKLDRIDLERSQNALASAEYAFKNEGDTYATRDRAARARRLAELAEATARMQEAALSKAQTPTKPQMEVPQLTAAEIPRVSPQPTAKAHAPLHVAQASDELRRFAWVTGEPRGMVIRVPSDMLFAHGQTKLTPDGQKKLDKVARAIVREGNDTTVSVEAHTDTQDAIFIGDEQTRARAEAVRNFLVRRGITSDRISAQGFGRSRPMSENTTVDGRARNRRVEIVVKLPQ